MALLGCDHGLGDIAADDVELGRFGKSDFVIGVLLGPGVGKGNPDLVFLFEPGGGLGNLGPS
jgi:hypothetical protein